MEDLCIRCSEIKDMAVRLQTVGMISWNLRTVTARSDCLIISETLLKSLQGAMPQHIE